MQRPQGQSAAEAGVTVRSIPIPRWMISSVLWTLGLIVLGVGAWLALRVLVTIGWIIVACFVAMLFAALLWPLNRLLRRALPRALAALCCLVSLLLVVAGIAGLAGYATAQKMDTLTTQFVHTFHTLLAHLPFGHATLERWQGALQRAVSSEAEHTQTVLSAAEKSVEMVAGALLCLFVLFFLLYQGPRLWRTTLRLAPSVARERIRAAGEVAWVTLSGFVQGTAVIAAIHAVVVGTAMYFLGVPIFLPLALLIFAGSFVPLLGAVLAGGVSVLVTLGTQGLLPAAILLAVILIENELEAHVLQPFVVGRYVRLHPLVIVLVLAIGSVWAGIAGTLAAVPVAGVLYNSWAPLRGWKVSPDLALDRPSRLNRLWHVLRGRRP